MRSLAADFISGAPTRPQPIDCVLIAGSITLMRALLQAQDPNYKPPPQSSDKPPEVIIGAVAITVETESRPPDGSVVGTCAGCGIKVHLAPSSQQLQRVHDGAFVLCMKDGGGCLAERMEKEKEPPTLGITEMGLEEMRKLYKRKP